MSAGSPIGRMRRRVTLEAPVETADDVGGVVRVFAPVAALWADIAPTGGETRFVADQAQERITHKVRLRWRDGVSAAMRFRIGARVLVIRDVADESETRRFLICQCLESKA